MNGPLEFGVNVNNREPLIAPDGLAPTLIEPALEHLHSRGVEIRLEHQLRAIKFDGSRIAALDFGDETVTLADADAGADVRHIQWLARMHLQHLFEPCMTAVRVRLERPLSSVSASVRQATIARTSSCSMARAT